MAGGARRVTRKWEVFAGRNRFWCDGRLMTAPHPGVFALTLALILGTCALHFAFDCPFLAARVSPAVPAVGAALAAFTLAALLRTALSDPGIIPRAAPPEGDEPPPSAPASAPATQRPPPRAREVLVRGRPVKLKYCFTCRMFRPPRASHCSLCDNCVDRFDHHCPWVGNCVGRRNYRYFYAFVVSLSFLAVFVFACSVTHLAMAARGAGGPGGGGLAAALRASPASALTAAVCFLSVWSVLGLAGFHTYLASTDQTTNEDVSVAPLPRCRPRPRPAHRSARVADQGLVLDATRRLQPEPVLARQRVPQLLARAVRAAGAEPHRPARRAASRRPAARALRPALRPARRPARRPAGTGAARLHEPLAGPRPRAAAGGGGVRGERQHRTERLQAAAAARHHDDRRRPRPGRARAARRCASAPRLASAPPVTSAAAAALSRHKNRQ